MERIDFRFSRQRGSLIALFLLALPAPALAQAARASLTGTVNDPSGAAIPGATVTVTDHERNAVESRTANEAGRYLFADLTPGAYTLEAAAPGFKKHRTTSLVLEVGQRLELSPTLEIGATSEEVTVTAGAVDIETATSTVSGVVDNRQVSELPLNGRDFYSLLQLVPNVRAGAPGGSAASVPSINGGRTWGAEAGVDGAPATNVGVPAPGAQGPGYQTGLDNVKEFRVLTNTLPAEYGNTYGGYISVVTKSGTNAFHGSGFEYLRNSRLDANNFFSNRAGLPLGSFRRNQFGASLGGPIVRNKTFFFVYYDGQRTTSGANQTRSVPTAAERAGDFSETRNAQGQRIVIYDSLTTRPDPSGSGNTRDAFPGNLIPQSRFDVVAQKVLAYLPAPNGPGNNFTHANNLITATPASSTNNKMDGRVDHSFNDRHSVFGRLSYGKSRNHQPTPLGGLDDANEREQPNWNTVVDYTFVRSSVTVVAAGFSYGQVTAFNIPAAARVEDYTMLGFSQGFARAIAPIFSYMPRFNMQIINSWGPDNSSVSWPRTLRASGSVSRVAGTHTLKTGADVRRIYGKNDPAESPKFSFNENLTRGPNPARATTTAGYAFASFLVGGGSGSMNAGVPLVESAPIVGLYLQDDWKATRKLTLNLGVRYDLFFPRTEAHDNLSYFDVVARNPLSDPTGLELRGGLGFVGRNGSARTQVPYDYNNVSPRVGFAYSIAPKLVLRGGYAIMYPMQSYGTVLATAAGVAGFGSVTNWTASTDALVNTSPLRNAFDTGLLPSADGSQGLLTNVGQSIGGAIPIYGSVSTYSEQWNLNVQRSLARNTLAEVSYLGNRGLHMPIPNIQLNQLTEQQMALGDRLADSVPNPFYGIIPSGSLGGRTTTRGQLMRPFPHFTGVNQNYRPSASSTYHALAVRFQARLQAGCVLSLAYTNSKAIDDVSEHWGTSYPIQDNLNLRSNRSISTQDISQSLVASWIVPIPVGKGKTLLHNARGPVQAILGGWQLNGIMSLRAGVPLGITCQQNTTGSQGGGCRPNSTGRSAKLSGAVAERLGRYFDTSQFTQPPFYTFGNLSRALPDVRSPSQRNVDVSIFKSFRPVEKLKLTFRAEAFNLTNTPLFGLPGTAFGNPNFGIITTQINSPRQLQMALRADF